MAELSPEGEAALEEAAETLEEVVDGINAARVQFGLLGLAVGAAIGAFVGWRIAEKRVREKYQQIAENEIDEMRQHFRQRAIAKETKPQISELSKRVTELGYSDQENPGTPNIPTREQLEASQGSRNIFTDSDRPDTAIYETWDYEEEKVAREARPDRPFVIHYDERGEAGFEEIQLTYYSGDDVLCDDKDHVVDNQDLIVGLANLDKFGHGSGSPDVIFVRNPEMKIDIEVNRSPNSYVEEVHGIKHEDSPRRRERPQWQ